MKSFTEAESYLIIIRQGLSRSYTYCIAEFLNDSYPDHLSIFYLPTSVGLRYGNLLLSLPRIFLAPEVIGITPLAESILRRRSRTLTDLPERA